MDSDYHPKALDKLADYLGRRDHSEAELRDKLARKFSQPAIDWAIQRAHDYGWLLDPVELSLKVATQLDIKKKSYLYIRQYLQKKGLPAPPIDESRELEKCREWLLIKFSDPQGLSFEQKQKAYKYLAYKGFDSVTIKKAIHEGE